MIEEISRTQREAWEGETNRLLATNPHSMHVLSAPERRARADFCRHRLLEVMADLPDPAEYARHLPGKAIEAMLRAQRGPDGWYLMPEHARIVIRYGLCEAGLTLRHHEIGVFGMAVLRELRRKDA